MEISLAPLQGYTEFPFRNALAKVIGGIDKFYTPFLRFENDGSLRSKHLKDLLPENNSVEKLIPQILVNNARDFLKMARMIEDQGYTEINWNLGCPYPMVAHRKLGSGLLAFPDTIKAILHEVIPRLHMGLSIKLRSGYAVDSEIVKVMEVLNEFPLAEVIYHPRIGKQLYKGLADVEHFVHMQAESNHLLAYNGDINSLEKLNILSRKLPEVNHFMIGRALISNPFLAVEIRSGKEITAVEKRMQFAAFYAELWEHYSRVLSGPSHLWNTFVHFWEYFSFLFVQDKRIFKHLKKCKQVHAFESMANFIIKNEPFKSEVL